MATKITKKQMLILQYIESYLTENNASPSYREIAEGLGLSSVSAVAEHIDNLVEKGALKKIDGAARSLELLDYRHTETVELFKKRLITSSPEETKILLKAMDILDLELPEV